MAKILTHVVNSVKKPQEMRHCDVFLANFFARKSKNFENIDVPLKKVFDFRTTKIFYNIWQQIQPHTTIIYAILCLPSFFYYNYPILKNNFI